MAGVNETLQGLFRRRARELSDNGKPLSVAEIHRRANGQVSYETLRQIEKGTHTAIGDEVVDGLCQALDVRPSEVLAAAGQRPRLGRFELPRRADRLVDRERQLIIETVDALLEAGERRQRDVGGTGRQTGKQAITGWRKSERSRADEG